MHSAIRNQAGGSATDNGESSVADLTKKVKSGVLVKHMAGMRFAGGRQCSKDVSAAVRSSSAQTAAQNSVQSAAAGSVAQQKQQRQKEQQRSRRWHVVFEEMLEKDRSQEGNEAVVAESDASVENEGGEGIQGYEITTAAPAATCWHECRTGANAAGKHCVQLTIFLPRTSGKTTEGTAASRR